LVFEEETDSFSWGSFFGLGHWGWTALEKGVDFGEDVRGENQVITWFGWRSGLALKLRLGWLVRVHCV
jgi:hypothetical protein